MRLPLTMMLLCSLLPFASLADSEPSEKLQTPTAESAPPAPAAATADATPAEDAPAPAAPSAAAQAQPATAPTRVAAAETDDDMTIVCKTERNVGTRFEKKTCRTKSAWQRIEKAAEEDFGAVRNRQMTCPSCQD